MDVADIEGLGGIIAGVSPLGGGRGSGRGRIGTLDGGGSLGLLLLGRLGLALGRGVLDSGGGHCDVVLRQSYRNSV